MLRFTRVTLTSFGRFREAEYLLQPGFNLVLGDNEAGKSTFAAAVAGVIFGFRRERERYLPWDGGGRCEAEVAFSYADREMTIARDFLTDRVRAVERQGDTVLWRFDGKVSPAGRSSEREEYLAKIEAIWGFSEGDIFRNSVYVGQRDLPIAGDTSLGNRLQQLLSGFSEMDYDGVMADLERELYSITRKPGGRARDRELEEVRARLAELATHWRAANESLAEVEKRRAALAELTDWLVTARADLDRGERYLERARQFLELEKQRTTLEAEFGRIVRERHKVEELLRTKSRLKEGLARYGDAVLLPDDFPAALSALRETREKLAERESQAFAAGARPERAGDGRERTVLFLVCFLWLVASGVIYRFFSLLVPGILTVTALTVVVALPSWRRRQQRHAASQRRAGRLEALNAEIFSLREAAVSWESRFPGTTDALSAWGDIAGFSAMKQQRAELAQVESALGVLPGHDFLVDQGRILARELAVIGERMENLIPKGAPLLSGEELLTAEEKLRRLETEVREKEQLCREQEQELAVMARTSLDLGAIEDEGEELRGRETRLARRVAALRLAIELLRETVEEYRSTYLSRFAREAEGRVGSLTAGRYREITFDAGFNLHVVAGGALRPVSALSCGAQDQTYLAARLALGSILSRGGELPFLLDDPLVNCDLERCAAALEALDRIACDHQVLLFTHDARYGRLKGAERWNKLMLR
jgi:energy-coupling factor transporter ATP-binding protein EcfA2